MTALPADWPNRADSRFVRSGGVEWHIQEKGDGPVLLLLHGTGAATHSWRDVTPIGAQHFRVLSLDLPGHGFTTGRPEGGLSLTGIARGIGRLLGDIGLEPAVVAGHSAGAAIVIRMVLDGIVRPKAVVAIAPALLPFPGIAQQIFPAMAKLLFVNPFAPHIFAQIARQPGMVEKFMRRATGSSIDQAGLDQYRNLFSNSAHCAGAIGMMADWNLELLERQLPELTVPLLVLHGEGDTAIPVATARKAAAKVPNHEFEAIPGRGHLLHEEIPDVVMQRIVSFAPVRNVLLNNEDG